MPLIENKDYKYSDNSLSIRLNSTWIDVKIDDYEFLEIIAPGANGVTVKARHIVTDRIVAIKVWKPRNNDLSKYKEQFSAEVQKIAKLKHPNIVDIYDAKVLDSNLCMAVYSYIDGIPLKKWLQNNHHLQNYIDIAKKLFETSIYFNEQHILHGDLHDGNIMITPQNDFRIIDFGTSLFSVDGQSKERELFFLQLLANKLFQSFPDFDSHHFMLICNEQKHKAKPDDNILPSLQFDPKLLAETLLEYTSILEFFLYIKHLDKTNIIELCRIISKTCYLDIKRISAYITEKKLDAKQKKLFKEIIIPSIEESVFPSVPEESFQLDRIWYLSMRAYCELAKKVLPTLINPVSEGYHGFFNNEQQKQEEEKYAFLICEITEWLSSNENEYNTTSHRLQFFFVVCGFFCSILTQFAR